MTVPSLSDRLRHLLEAETAHAQHLLEAMLREHEALLGRDALAIENAVDSKAQHLEAFETAEKRRKATLDEAAVPHDRASIRRFLDALPDQQPDELATLWDRLLHVASACRDQNRINASLVEMARRHVQRALDVLRGTPGGAHTYGPGGQANHGSASHTLVKA